MIDQNTVSVEDFRCIKKYVLLAILSTEFPTDLLLVSPILSMRPKRWLRRMNMILNPTTREKSRNDQENFLTTCLHLTKMMKLQGLPTMVLCLQI